MLWEKTKQVKTIKFQNKVFKFNKNMTKKKFVKPKKISGTKNL